MQKEKQHRYKSRFSGLHSVVIAIVSILLQNQKQLKKLKAAQQAAVIFLSMTY